MASDTFNSDRLDAYIEESDRVLREVQIPAMIRHEIIPKRIIPRDTQEQYDGIDIVASFYNNEVTIDAKHRNAFARGTDLNLDVSGPGTSNWRKSKTDIYFLSAWNKALGRYQHSAYWKADIERFVDAINPPTTTVNGNQEVLFLRPADLWALDILGGEGQ